MAKFPVDAPKAKVVKALTSLGFRLVREREHIAMVRDNPDGARQSRRCANTADYAKPPAHQRLDTAHDLHAIGNLARGVFESIYAKLRMHGPHFCSMKITQDVREYVATHGV